MLKTTLLTAAAAALFLTACQNPGETSAATTPGIPDTPVPPPNVQLVSAGWWSYAFVRSDGSLWTMGNNGFGLLAVGDLKNRSKPVKVATDVVSAAVEANYLVYVKKDGTRWGAGHGGLHQFAPGHVDVEQPNAFQTGTGAAAASVGYSHTLYLGTTGELFAAGDNSKGAFGDGSTASTPADGNPTDVMGSVAQISAGDGFSFIVKTDQTLWVSGDNRYGQLGTGDTSRVFTFQQQASNVAMAIGTTYNGLYITNDATRTLYAAGYNNHNQIDDVDTNNRTSFTPVDTGVLTAAGGLYFLVWVKQDHTLWGRGDPTGGVLGDVTEDQTKPIQIASQVISVSAKGRSVAFIKEDGTAWIMGDNYGGIPVAITFED